VRLGIRPVQLSGRALQALGHPTLAQLHIDLVIGAGGVTPGERCCLGSPRLALSIAENQRPACEVLADTGVIAYLGHKTVVAAEKLRRPVQALLVAHRLDCHQRWPDDHHEEEKGL